MSIEATEQLIATERNVTSAGATTIPARIRHRMGIEPGSKVKFIWNGEELVVVKAE